MFRFNKDETASLILPVCAAIGLTHSTRALHLVSDDECNDAVRKLQNSFMNIIFFYALFENTVPKYKNRGVLQGLSLV